jgi:hypothetical protein
METDVNTAGLCDCLGWVFLQNVHTAKITAHAEMDGIWQNSFCKQPCVHGRRSL